MVVMAIGISAIVAGFSSGIVAVNRARLTSTAGALADQQMELYRQAVVRLAADGHAAPTAPTRAGRPDLLDAGRRVWTCASAPYPRGPPASLLRHPREPAGEARDDHGARRLDDRGDAPLHRELDLRLLDRLTTHST